MNQADLEKANIDNLTQLWKLMGAETTRASHNNPLYSSTSWPFRVWYDWGLQLKTDDTDALIQKVNCSDRYCVPTWGYSGQPLRNTLTDNGFTLWFQQIAMVINLDCYDILTTDSLSPFKIKISKDCATWTTIAALSFGYPIDVEVIQRIAKSDDLQLFTAFYKDKPIATAMLFHASGIIGIHQVGVLPAYRGKGIARQVMQHLLNRCVTLGSRYAALQASPMGQRLYQSLGFAEQFKIGNYRFGPTDHS